MEIQQAQEPTAAQHWIWDGQRSRPARGAVSVGPGSRSERLYERKDDGGYIVHVFHFEDGMSGQLIAPDGSRFEVDAQGVITEAAVAEPTD
jgi:hypothetical protein